MKEYLCKCIHGLKAKNWVENHKKYIERKIRLYTLRNQGKMDVDKMQDNLKHTLIPTHIKNIHDLRINMTHSRKRWHK